MSRKQKPLHVISELPADEQTEIYHLMLHNHKTYGEISDLLFERHGYRVSRNTIGRHFHRCQGDEDFEALPEIKASASEWLYYKETGETAQFDEAALERLKLKAFQLSGTLKDQKELTQLKSLFGILFAARLAEVRERTVAVRERLAAVRETKAAQDPAPRRMRTTPTSDPSHPTDQSNPSRTPDLENIEEPENPTAPTSSSAGGPLPRLHPATAGRASSLAEGTAHSPLEEPTSTSEGIPDPRQRPATAGPAQREDVETAHDE